MINDYKTYLCRQNKRIMRSKQYVKTCEVCGKQYIATRSGSHCCSSTCRSKYNRDKKESTIKSQEKIIRVQTDILTKEKRNTYIGIIDQKAVIINGPEGTDIAKTFNLRKGTESVLEQIKALPVPKRKLYKLKYVSLT